MSTWQARAPVDHLFLGAGGIITCILLQEHDTHFRFAYNHTGNKNGIAGARVTGSKQ
jgi:hypothetical protein